MEKNSDPGWKKEGFAINIPYPQHFSTTNSVRIYTNEFHCRRNTVIIGKGEADFPS
jgi:hypothetical protein